MALRISRRSVVLGAPPVDRTIRGGDEFPLWVAQIGEVRLPDGVKMQKLPRKTRCHLCDTGRPLTIFASGIRVFLYRQCR